MAKHDVRVIQLQSDWGNSYLNVDDTKPGQLEVWGSCYTMPVYLYQNGICFHLLVFDNEEFANEWLEKHKTLSRHEKLLKITPIAKKGLSGKVVDAPDD